MEVKAERRAGCCRSHCPREVSRSRRCSCSRRPTSRSRSRAASYNPTIADPRIGKVKILRPQEIPLFVQDGHFDLGISGHDWVDRDRRRRRRGRRAALREDRHRRRADGARGAGRLADIRTAARHRAGQPHHHRVPQRHARLLRGARHPGRGALQLRRDRGQGARDDGRAGRPDRDRLDAAPQRPARSSTSCSTSTTRLLANKDAWADPDKRREIEEIRTLLLGVIEARGRVLLSMNVPEARLDERHRACCRR